MTQPEMPGQVISLAEARASRQIRAAASAQEAAVPAAEREMAERDLKNVAFWRNSVFFALRLQDRRYGRLTYQLVKVGDRHYLDLDCEAFRSLYPLDDKFFVDMDGTPLHLEWRGEGASPQPLSPVPTYEVIE